MGIITDVRLVLLAAGTAAVVGGAVHAARPFAIGIALADGRAPAPCRPPCVAAWHRGPEGEVALWAVTYGEGPMGYEVRCGAEPYCARMARRRLALAAALLGGGLAAVLAGAGVV